MGYREPGWPVRPDGTRRQRPGDGDLPHLHIKRAGHVSKLVGSARGHRTTGFRGRIFSHTPHERNLGDSDSATRPRASHACEYRVSCNGGSAQEPQERDFLPDRGATPGTSRRKTAPVSKLAWWEAPRKAKHGIRRKRNLDGDHLQIRLLHPRGGSNSAQRTRGRTCGHGGLRTDSRSSKGAPPAKPEPSEVHCAQPCLKVNFSKA